VFVGRVKFRRKKIENEDEKTEISFLDACYIAGNIPK